MKLYKSTFVILFFIACATSVVLAQSDVIVSGGRATGSGGNATYSVGQVNYSYIKSGNGSMSQGLQHAFEIFVVKEETDTTSGFQISATVYPNPTAGFLNIRIDEGKIEDLSYRIIDEEGRLVAQQKIVNKETPVSLVDLKNSLYYVKVYKSIFVMKTFKVVKTK